MDHLLLHCVTTGYLWQLIFLLFGLQWVMHSSVRSMLLSWSGVQVGKKTEESLPSCPFVPFLGHLV